MNELKKELSKLTGIDMFNPKFRDVFKKYFPDDKDEKVDEKEENLKEILTEEKAPEVVDNEPEKVEEPKETEANDNIEDKVEDIDKAEDEREIDKIEEQKADTTEKADEKEEAKNEESKEIGKEVDELKGDYKDDNRALLDAKVELELVKADVRDDRLEPAKKLFMDDIHSLEDVEKIKEMIKQYPEWIKKDKNNNVKPFGINLDDNGEGLTEEEKKLKAMGINPRG